MVTARAACYPVLYARTDLLAAIDREGGPDGLPLPDAARAGGCAEDVAEARLRWAARCGEAECVEGRWRATPLGRALFPAPFNPDRLPF